MGRYDGHIDLINSMLETFKEQNLKPEDITLWFDMDNTLFVFSIWGQEPEALKKMNLTGYFLNLPIMPEAVCTLKTLHDIGFNLKIISVCINERCKSEKMRSMLFHFDFIEEKDIHLVMKGVNKSEYIKSLGYDISKCLLLDDYYGNILDWYEAGGIAIKKSYSGKQRPVPQIESLTDIFRVLINLNVKFN